jgi:hypothetical protein
MRQVHILHRSLWLTFLTVGSKQRDAADSHHEFIADGSQRRAKHGPQATNSHGYYRRLSWVLEDAGRWLMVWRSAIRHAGDVQPDGWMGLFPRIAGMAVCVTSSKTASSRGCSRQVCGQYSTNSSVPASRSRPTMSVK